jgi:membrane fusion protein, copper/silver efflux system
MRHPLTRIVLLSLISLIGVASLQASDAMKAIVGSYLEIHAQLAADKIDGIKTPASAIASRAEAMGQSGAAMAKAAKAIGAASDIKVAREAFGTLSDAVIAAAKADGYKDLSDVKLAYCPMVRKSWLQKGNQIQNPYYGKDMSTCGELRKPQ